MTFVVVSKTHHDECFTLDNLLRIYAHADCHACSFVGLFSLSSMDGRGDGGAGSQGGFTFDTNLASMHTYLGGMLALPVDLLWM